MEQNIKLSEKQKFKKSLAYLLCTTFITSERTATVAQWVRALAPKFEGWEFESQPRQTNVVRTGSGSSTAKRSEIGVRVTGSRR